MLGYNRTITRTNINVLINIGPGAGGGRKRSGKKGNLPNTFDDDCSLRNSRRFVTSQQIMSEKRAQKFYTDDASLNLDLG